jgi:hypothetical protein
MLRDSQRVEELLHQHLARVHRVDLGHCHHLLVVVHDLDILGTRIGR